MNIYFSSSQLAFYIDENATDIPRDLVEVSDDVANKFIGVPWPKGKVLGSGSDSGPAWVDAAPLTQNELIAQAEDEKQLRIDEANAYINNQQWPSKLALGRLSDIDKAKFNVWLDYIDAAQAVDTSTAPDITWPVLPQ